MSKLTKAQSDGLRLILDMLIEEAHSLSTNEPAGNKLDKLEKIGLLKGYDSYGGFDYFNLTNKAKAALRAALSERQP